MSFSDRINDFLEPVASLFGFTRNPENSALSMIGISRRRNISARLIMLGLDAAGKTTFCYKIRPRGSEVHTTIPTIGFNVETLQLKNFAMVCWDVGGCDKIRPLWRHFTNGASMLVFVVDCNDVERTQYAKDEMHLFLNDDTVKDMPVLILANKQDLRENKADKNSVLNVLQVIDKLGLASVEDRKWFVQATCMTDGTGVPEAMRWIENILFPNKKKTMKTPSAADEGFANGPFNLTSEEYFDKHHSHSNSEPEGGNSTASSRVSSSLHNSTVKASAASGGNVTNIEATPSAIDLQLNTDSPEVIAAQMAEAKRVSDIALKHSVLTAWIDRARQEIASCTDNSIIGESSTENSSSSSMETAAEDRFLSQVRDYTLDSWDHYTHVRLGWIVLHRECVLKGASFQDAFESVAGMIASFIAHSERTNGKSFHRTMTHFWCHMIAVHMQLLLVSTQQQQQSGAASSGDGSEGGTQEGGEFVLFLASLTAPYAVDLWNTASFKAYYSNQVMFGAEARAGVVQPDIQPLPVFNSSGFRIYKLIV